MHASAGPETYEGIFDARAHRYERAMQRCPQARREEFQAVLAVLQATPGERIADLPCGGGYLGAALGPGVALVGVDPSVAFHALGVRHAAYPVHHAPLSDLPFEDGSLDGIVSVAGLHHAPDLPAIFSEFRRVVRVGGRVVVADVEEGSGPARFLDGFVNDHNPQGHRGAYFHPGTRDGLMAPGWRIAHDAVVSYRWRYDSTARLRSYLVDLFGMDGDASGLSEAVSTDLGLLASPSEVSHGWSLRILRADRAA